MDPSGQICHSDAPIHSDIKRISGDRKKNGRNRMLSARGVTRGDTQKIVVGCLTTGLNAEGVEA